MRGIGAGTRIFELLDRRPAIPHNMGVNLTPTRRGPVRFEGVQFEYPSRKGVEILKDFDLEIGVGESVAIVYGVWTFLGARVLTKNVLAITGGRAVVGNPRSNPFFCATMTL